MGRFMQSGQLARFQADFFSAPFVRVSGVVASDITISLFVNNSALSWTVIDGTAVADSSISSGKVYFNEISGHAGFYSVRFFPDRIGYWRLVLRSTSLSQEYSIEFDLVPQASSSPGLTATFVK